MDNSGFVNEYGPIAIAVMSNPERGFLESYEFRQGT
jgi:hypothetical protein